MENVTKTKPTIITIFGGSGDLTWRKLIPALYNLNIDNWLNEKFSIICIGRDETKNETFLTRLKTGVDKFSRRGKTKKAEWDKFAKNIHYKAGDFTKKMMYADLKKDINLFDKDPSCDVNKIFYLAVNPQFFEIIAERLSESGPVSYTHLTLPTKRIV